MNWVRTVSCNESPDASEMTANVALTPMLPAADASDVIASSTDRDAVAVIVPTVWYVSPVFVIVCVDSVPDVRVSTSVESAVSAAAAVRAAVVAPVPIATNFGGFLVVVVWRRSAAVRFPLFVHTVAVPNGTGQPTFRQEAASPSSDGTSASIDTTYPSDSG